MWQTISAGYLHTCGVLVVGRKAECFGYTYFGQTTVPSGGDVDGGWVVRALPAEGHCARAHPSVVRVRLSA